VTFVGTIPKAPVEENFRGNVRYHVNIGSWYDDNGRGRGDTVRGRRTYVDIHADLRIT